MSKSKLNKVLKKNKIILMDGGLGTEILRRGYNTTLPLWSAEILIKNPQIVKEIHTDYIKAGAQIIITNTFRTTERTLRKKGLSGGATELTLLACRLAREAIAETQPKQDVFVAGSIAPLEDCYSPESTPDEKSLKIEHLKYARDLKEGGVDFLLLETMITWKELFFALEAAKKVNLPVAISLCCNDKLQLLGGEPLSEIIEKVKVYKPIFIGVNCTSQPIANQVVKYFKSKTALPISVYAQGDGVPHKYQGWKFDDQKQLEIYIESAKEWVKNGAKIIGGCCGTTPLYIQKLSQTLKSVNQI